MPTPRRGRPARLRLLCALLLAVVVAVGASCGSGGGSSDQPDDRPTADEAARVIAEGFGLDDAAQRCLREAFDSEHIRSAVAAALDGCISPESFADAVAVAVAGAVPGGTPERDACLRGAVLALEPDQRSTVMLGLVLSGDTEIDELQTERAQIVQGLYDECDVSLTPGTTAAAPG